MTTRSIEELMISATDTRNQHWTLDEMMSMLCNDDYIVRVSQTQAIHVMEREDPVPLYRVSLSQWGYVPVREGYGLTVRLALLDASRDMPDYPWTEARLGTLPIREKERGS